jgi:hypothetical protein
MAAAAGQSVHAGGLGHDRGMAKWLCACGVTIQSSGTIPNESQWLLMSDQEFEAFTGLVQAEDVYTNMTVAFKCPTCGRLHIFWQGLENDPVVYAPEP